MLMLIARIQIEDGVTNSSCRNYYEQRQPKISDETGWHRPGIKRWNTGRNDNHKLARCGRQARAVKESFLLRQVNARHAGTKNQAAFSATFGSATALFLAR